MSEKKNDWVYKLRDSTGGGMPWKEGLFWEDKQA